MDSFSFDDPYFWVIPIFSFSYLNIIHLNYLSIFIIASLRSLSAKSSMSPLKVNFYWPFFFFLLRIGHIFLFIWMYLVCNYWILDILDNMLLQLWFCPFPLQEFTYFFSNSPQLNMWHQICLLHVYLFVLCLVTVLIIFIEWLFIKVMFISIYLNCQSKICQSIYSNTLNP